MSATKFSKQRFDNYPTVSSLNCNLLVVEADSYRRRLIGMALLRTPPQNTALLLPKTSSIHTFGMYFELDLLWLDANGVLLAIDQRVAPRRLRSKRGAKSVVEAQAGLLDLERLQIGKKI